MALTPAEFSGIVKRTHMSLIAWILLGLVAGFLGSKFIYRSGKSIVFDIMLGVLGATVDGFAFNLVGASRTTGFKMYSLFVATVGSILFLALYHALFRRA